MNKKRWALLVLAVIMVLGYIKLFYKTYSETAVIKNADRIIVLDVKRIINTLIWQYITTPGQWKSGRLFPKEDEKVSWKDMFVLPDYVFAFHAKGQPGNAWYVQLTIKDKTDLEKGLAQFHFQKINDQEYVSKQYGIRLLLKDDKVLVANAAVTDTACVTAVADELFNKRSYIARATLATAIKGNSHLALYFAPNDFLQKEAVITANFDKEKIKISGTISPGKPYAFTEANFKFNPGDLFTAGFTQPPAAVYGLMSYTAKEKISKALNVNIDSVMLQSNSSYSLKLSSIKQRVDSAISYAYDEEFNKVEKVVVNNILEPAFELTITGNKVSAIYAYLKRNNKLENTAAGELFTPMPLVRSYVSLADEKQLKIRAANFTATAETGAVNAVFFCDLAIAKIPAEVQKYLPDHIIRTLSNVAAIKLTLTKKEEDILLNAVIEKKKNGQPIIKF